MANTYPNDLICFDLTFLAIFNALKQPKIAFYTLGNSLIWKIKNPTGSLHKVRHT